MGRFLSGLCLGLVLGLTFSPILFPDGVDSTLQRLVDDIRGDLPTSLP